MPPWGLTACDAPPGLYPKRLQVSINLAELPSSIELIRITAVPVPVPLRAATGQKRSLNADEFWSSSVVMRHLAYVASS